MRVACVQFDIAWEDKPANFARVRALLDAAHLPADTLVLLPEMFATGFSMNVAGIHENSGGETLRFLSRCAAELRLYLLGGLVTRVNDRGRNEGVLFGPDGAELARYCKLHPFSYAGETEHYASGEECVTVRVLDTLLAPFICYDLRFPEVFRCAVRRGAEVFAVIANWPQAREAHWLALLKARAIENQAYVAAVNRCGRDPKHAYSGRSLIIDPRGEVLADAGGGEKMIQAELDLDALRAYRREFPVLADVRPEFHPR